jgi:hypothetical protein
MWINESIYIVKAVCKNVDECTMVILERSIHQVRLRYVSLMTIEGPLCSARIHWRW